jgi:hypothetical protein
MGAIPMHIARKFPEASTIQAAACPFSQITSPPGGSGHLQVLASLSPLNRKLELRVVLPHDIRPDLTCGNQPRKHFQRFVDIACAEV